MANPLARRTVRLAVGAAITTAFPTGYAIQSPGDWETPPDTLPAILYRTKRDDKAGFTRSAPNFTTTVQVEIEARIEAATAAAAQDAIDALGATLEQAIFTDYALTKLIQQIPACSTEIDITSEGRRHLAGLKMTMLLEVFEEFYPSITQPLAEITIHADLAGTFDPSGTYTGSLFPTAVKPAPRTTGPDGRDEGALDIILPQ